MAVSKRSQRSKKSNPIKITKGALTYVNPKTKKEMGYHIHLSEPRRRMILRGILKHPHGANPKNGRKIQQALIARRTLGKNRLSEEQKHVLTQDAAYIKKVAQKLDLWM